jgi:hypothetical protein
MGLICGYRRICSNPTVPVWRAAVRSNALLPSEAKGGSRLFAYIFTKADFKEAGSHQQSGEQWTASGSVPVLHAPTMPIWQSMPTSVPSLATSGSTTKEHLLRCHCSHWPGQAVQPRSPCFGVIAVTGRVRQYNQGAPASVSLQSLAGSGSTTKEPLLRCHCCHWPGQAVQPRSPCFGVSAVTGWIRQYYQEAPASVSLQSLAGSNSSVQESPASVPCLLLPISSAITRMALP